MSQYDELVALMDQAEQAGELTPADRALIHQKMSQKGLGPGTPKPALPTGLQPETPGFLGRVNNTFTSVMDESARDAAKAYHDLRDNPGVDAKLKAGSDLLRSVAKPYALPLLIAGATANPIGTALAVGAGAVAAPIAGSFVGSLAGPGAAQAAEDVAALLAGRAGYKSNVVQRASGAVREALFGGEPVDLATRALKPTKNNLRFKEDAKTALPDIAREGPVDNLEGFRANSLSAKQKLWSLYEQWQGPPARQPDGTITKTPRKQWLVDLTPVAENIERTITHTTKIEDPNKVAAVKALADAYRRQVPINVAEQLLQETNASLDSYYAKMPWARSQALTNPETAAEAGKGVALRDAIYKSLDTLGGGTTPRAIKQRYGAIMNLDQEAAGRINIAARANPDSLVQQASKLGAAYKISKGVLTGNTADVAEGVLGTKVANWIKEQNTSDALIKRAINNAGKLPAPADLPGPPVTQIRGYLPKGSIQMPGVPDPSGPVPGPGPYPGMGMSPSIGTRLLERPSIKMPGDVPQDPSGPTGRQPYPGMGIAPSMQRWALPAGQPPPARVLPGPGETPGFRDVDMLRRVDPVTGAVVYESPWAGGWWPKNWPGQ